MTPCPAQCGRAQKPGKFLCFQCWQHLAPRIRADVNRTWQDLGTIDREKDSIAFRCAVRAYRMARESALRFLKSNPAPHAVVRAKAESLFTRREA